MYIKCRPLSLVFKLVIFFAALAGLLLQAGVPAEVRLSSLKMFTTLSNLLVALYYLAEILWLVLRRPERTTLCPVVKFVALMCILLTGLVAFFLLGGMLANSTASMRVALLLLHDVVPICVVVDWALFDKKGQWKTWYPAVAALAPIAYVAVAMVSAQFGSGLGSGASRYPYPFLNVDTLGWPIVALSIVSIAAAFLFLGWFLCLIDRVLGRGAKPKT